MVGVEYGPFFGATIAPWKVDVVYIEYPNSTLLTAEITYSQPPTLNGLTWVAVSASDSTVSVFLPDNLHLVDSEQTVSIPISNPGDSCTVQWTLTADPLDYGV